MEESSKKPDDPDDGYIIVYCRSIKKNGKTYYPKKGKVFKLRIKPKKAA